MRKLLLPPLCLGIVLSAYAAVAFAQPTGGLMEKLLKETTPEQRAQIRTDRMKQALGLDAGQVEKVHAINLKYAKEATEILAGTAVERASKLEAMSKRKDEELKGVLSSEQFQKYGVEREGWRAQAGQAEAGGPAKAANGKADTEGATEAP